MSSKTGTVLYLLCSAALLLALYLARQPSPDRHGTALPTAVPPPARDMAHSQSTVRQSEYPKKLQLSIEHHVDGLMPFGQPPDLFNAADDTPEASPNVLFDTLSTQQEESDYSVSGKLILEDDPDYTLKSVDGLQLEVHIKTQ